MLEKVCPICKGTGKCQNCEGTGKVTKTLEQCTAEELAEEAHKRACELWSKHDDLADLVAILHELKKKLSDC